MRLQLSSPRGLQEAHLAISLMIVGGREGGSAVVRNGAASKYADSVLDQSATCP